MRGFIHKLRQKPKSTRQKIALGTSASITGVIFAVWLTVMIAGGGAGVTETTSSQSQAASPLGALEDNAGSALSSVRDRLSGTSTATSAQQPTSKPERKQSTTSQSQQVQPVDNRPYWENNSPSTSATESKSEQKSRPQSPAQAGSDFWGERKLKRYQ